MTPVEERIDHEEAKRIAESRKHDPNFPTFSLLARAYLDLLTEHSAREEALARAAFLLCSEIDIPHTDAECDLCLAIRPYYPLPATESAQPEEEPYESYIAGQGANLDAPHEGEDEGA